MGFLDIFSSPKPNRKKTNNNKPKKQSHGHAHYGMRSSCKHCREKKHTDAHRFHKTPTNKTPFCSTHHNIKNPIIKKYCKV